jgi:hemophore-related protein
MVKLPSTKLLVAFGGLALSLTTGVGVASAQPDLGPLINTTCNEGQVLNALNAQPGDLASQYNAQPMAESMLRRFLASPVNQRMQIAQEVQGMFGPQEVDTLLLVAKTCNNY